jgi:uncharacterized membrane protein YozB (DUF420 family)
VTAEDVLWMPAMNACLNATATVLLVTGWRRIRARDVEGHRRAMIAACVASAAFLVSYVVHKGIVRSHRPYTGDGLDRVLYQCVLWTHLTLAIAMVWLVPRTLFLAFRDRREEHRRIARWTLPVWLYVSVTGVVVYLMLYPFAPAPRPS